MVAIDYESCLTISYFGDDVEVDVDMGRVVVIMFVCLLNRRIKVGGRASLLFSLFVPAAHLVFSCVGDVMWLAHTISA